MVSYKKWTTCIHETS